ncbi:hypothetical protein [Porphyrobacter sp. YT40]|uniref:hypothetical protein n=1 Tax=Porphyrobacter sp. YT40 TaxID=2547601 RepID=UPI001142BF8D|nr:hypothetical protein [Porphyrobacter sp. YT40]QDH35034.1 hypothetical protein E2E27_12300 [Porphyrobacter sp. YT40]
MALPPVRPLAERKVAADFLAAGAVSMADAIPYAPTRPSRRRAFERLKGADVLRTDGHGRYWLDEERWQGRRSDRRTKAIVALLAVGVAAAVAALR